MDKGSLKILPFKTLFHYCDTISEKFLIVYYSSPCFYFYLELSLARDISQIPNKQQIQFLENI